MNLAIIPARGGSKRIPRKNIKNFNGKPMISWSIELAIESRVFDKIVVSTDDNEIQEIAIKKGAEVPFLRPKDLSDDHTPTAPVVKHVITELNQLGHNYKNVCCIYPCAPFIKPDDLKKSLQFLDKGFDFVYPVIEYTHPIQRAMQKDLDGIMKFIQPSFELSRTQDLDKTFHDAGQFYWGKTLSWLSDKRMHSSGYGFEVPHWRFIDIDNPDDWQRAEIMHEILKRA